MYLYHKVKPCKRIRYQKYWGEISDGCKDTRSATFLVASFDFTISFSLLHNLCIMYRLHSGLFWDLLSSLNETPSAMQLTMHAWMIMHNRFHPRNYSHNSCFLRVKGLVQPYLVIQLGLHLGSIYSFVWLALHFFYYCLQFKYQGFWQLAGFTMARAVVYLTCSNSCSFFFWIFILFTFYK